MRRHLTFIVMLTVLLLGAAACGSDSAPERAAAPVAAAGPARPPESWPLHLPACAGLASVDPDTGTVGFERPNAVPSPSESVVAGSTIQGQTTHVSLLDPATGAETSGLDVDGRME